MLSTTQQEELRLNMRVTQAGILYPCTDCQCDSLIQHIGKHQMNARIHTRNAILVSRIALPNSLSVMHRVREVHDNQMSVLRPAGDARHGDHKALAPVGPVSRRWSAASASMTR